MITAEVKKALLVDENSAEVARATVMPALAPATYTPMADPSCCRGNQAPKILAALALMDAVPKPRASIQMKRSPNPTALMRPKLLIAAIINPAVTVLLTPKRSAMAPAGIPNTAAVNMGAARTMANCSGRRCRPGMMRPAKPAI